MSLFLDLDCGKSIEEIIKINATTASDLRRKISLLNQTEKISEEKILEKVLDL